MRRGGPYSHGNAEYRQRLADATGAFRLACAEMKKERGAFAGKCGEQSDSVVRSSPFVQEKPPLLSEGRGAVSSIL